MVTSDVATAVKAFFNNRQLMMKELVRVIGKGGGVVPLVLRPAQRDFLTSRTERDIILKARQLGFSTLIEADYLLDAISMPNIRVATVVQNEEAIPKFMAAYHGMWERLPEVVDLGGVQVRVKPLAQVDNVGTLSFDNGSTINVLTSGGVRLGRGTTYHRALLTEVAFWDEESAGDVWAAIEGSMPPQGSRIVVETTALGRRGAFWDKWNAAWVGDSLYKPHFYPWWWEPEYAYSVNAPEVPDKIAKMPPTIPEQDLMTRHGLTFEQILFRRVKELALGVLKRQQEYPESAEEAFTTFGDSIFTLDQRAMVRRFACAPLWERDRLRVWKDPDPTLRYVVCVDSSQGVTGASDFDAISVLCVQPPYVEHVATWMGRVAAHELAKEAANIATHYNTATLCVEVMESSGGAVMEALSNSIKYPRLYTRSDGQYGWKTTKWTKDPMIDALKELIDRDLFRTYDVRVSEQMTTYEEHMLSNGSTRVGAPRGAYDDLLTTIMMGAKILPEISRSKTKTIHYGRKKW